MEFCEKSTLRQAIDNNLYQDMNRVWRYFREVLEGLAHIHEQVAMKPRKHTTINQSIKHFIMTLSILKDNKTLKLSTIKLSSWIFACSFLLSTTYTAADSHSVAWWYFLSRVCFQYVSVQLYLKHLVSFAGHDTQRSETQQHLHWFKWPCQNWWLWLGNDRYYQQSRLPLLLWFCYSYSQCIGVRLQHL